MKRHSRISAAPRRLLLQERAPAANFTRTSSTNGTSNSTSTTSSKATSIPPPTNPYYPKNNKSTSDSSPDGASANTDVVRFDSSSVAVTALVILSALFFLGFFSVYARRFFSPEWDGSDASNSRRRRLARRGRMTAASVAGGRCGTPRGLDPEAIKALPLVRYSAPADVVRSKTGSKDEAGNKGGTGVEVDDMEVDDIHRCCAVCLGEFEDGEELRAIPGCGHAFHRECIDAWLAARGSCPLCRTTDLFGTAKQQKVAANGPGAATQVLQRVRCDACRLESVVVMPPADEGAGSGQGEGGGGTRRLESGFGNGDQQLPTATAAVTAPMASPETRGAGGIGRSRSWLCMSVVASQEEADEEKGPPPPASNSTDKQPQPPRRSFS